jgi:hypothetical protein
MGRITICATLISLGLLHAQPGFAQHQDCGKPPEYESKSEDQQKTIADLQAKAQLLAKLVGSADLGGQFNTERKTIFRNSPAAEAARRDAYLMYMVCVLVMDDRSLPTVEELKALSEFKNPIETTPSFGVQIDQLSILVDEAEAIQQTFLDRNDPTLIANQYADWSQRVQQYLNAFGRSYVVQFRNAPSPAHMPMNHSVVGGGVWQKVEGQKAALLSIMTELRRAR